MSKLYAALGIQLWVGDDNSIETFFKVARVGDVSGPQEKVDTIDATTHQSAENPDGPYREFILSLIDAGTATFPIMLDPAEESQNEAPTIVGVQAGGLRYLMKNRLRRNMRMVFPFTSPEARVRMFGGVTGMNFDGKVAGMLMYTVTLKLSGPATLEAGSGNS